MAHTPVIAQDDKITYAQCGICGGLGFYGIDRFMDDSDRADLEGLAARGYKISQATVGAKVCSEECFCKVEVVQKPSIPVITLTRSAIPRSSKKPSGKSTLTLSVSRK
jgi:hypothetical protein